MVKTYTEIYKGFQIRDPVYIGEPPKDIPPTYDIVKWFKNDPDHCYTVGWLIYDEKEPCFNFKSCGLRWLEEAPDEDVCKWIIRWCDYKLIELDREDNEYY